MLESYVPITLEQLKNPRGVEELNRMLRNIYDFCPRWVNLGDVSAYHFTVGNFGCDDAVRDLDLSGVIPKGTYLALAWLSITSTVAGARIRFRKNGYSNWRNCAYLKTQNTSYCTNGDIWLMPDASGIVEYQVPSSMNGIWLTLRGYFIGGAMGGE